MMNDYLKYTISPTAQYACLYDISSELGASAGKLVLIAGFGLSCINKKSIKMVVKLFGDVINISYISNKKEMKETKYPNYFANEQGDIFSNKQGSIKKLKPATHNKKYLQLVIYNNCKPKNIRVNRLIAETFIPNPENKPEVNHKNGIKSDNRVQNLEWVTSKENMNHAKSTGLFNNSGENNVNSKLTKEQVIEIRYLYSTKKYTHRGLGKMFNVSQTNICQIINKKRWKE